MILRIENALCLSRYILEIYLYNIHTIFDLYRAPQEPGRGEKGTGAGKVPEREELEGQRRRLRGGEGSGDGEA